jgi:hypothetical protein
MSESETGLRRLIEALDGLGIPFLVGGSMASSIHGVPRATMDIDLVVDLTPEHIALLSRTLDAEFYVDAQALEEALRTGRAFNLIHYASTYKFDLFPLSSDPFHQSEFHRRVIVQVEVHGAGPLRLPVATAEDTILAKLKWYRMGGEVATRQWSDVLGVLQVSGSQMDMAYLSSWSRHLGVQDLFDRALSEASQGRGRL